MTPTETFTLDHNGTPVRVAMAGDEPWFVVTDLCRALDLYMRNGKPMTYEALRRLQPRAKSHRLVDTPRGPRLVSVVSRDGVADMTFWAKRRGSPDLFVWDINEAMVSGRYQTAAA